RGVGVASRSGIRTPRDPGGARSRVRSLARTASRDCLGPGAHRLSARRRRLRTKPGRLGAAGTGAAPGITRDRALDRRRALVGKRRAARIGCERHGVSGDSVRDLDRARRGRTLGRQRDDSRGAGAAQRPSRLYFISAWTLLALSSLKYSTGLFLLPPT